jgi:hypothetical protein
MAGFLVFARHISAVSPSLNQKVNIFWWKAELGQHDKHHLRWYAWLL